MARVFVTGSTDGIGLTTARQLLDAGHEVVVHARNTDRLEAVSDLVDRGADAVVGDLADLDQTTSIAEQVNGLGRMDAVIHNAGVDGSRPILPVNVVAPYLLTALITRPARLIYLSSSMHRGGHATLSRLDWSGRTATASYSDSKLLVTVLAIAIANRWPDVYANAVDPGWVPTRMGGTSAPDDLEEGCRTQVWLATSEDPQALVTGGYWHHRQQQQSARAAGDERLQGQLLDALARHTGRSLR